MRWLSGDGWCSPGVSGGEPQGEGAQPPGSGAGSAATGGGRAPVPGERSESGCAERVFSKPYKFGGQVHERIGEQLGGKAPQRCDLEGAIGPGGQTVLPGQPGQLGLDGRVYDFRPGRSTPERPAPRPGTLDPLPDPHAQRAGKRDRHSLAFGFKRDADRDGPCERCRHDGVAECRHGVGYQLTFEEWQRQTARALDWLNPFDGARAERVRKCGSMVQVKECRGCGNVDAENAVASSDCMARVCPSCARESSKERRATLKAALKQWPIQRRGTTPFHVVVTVPSRPGTSVYTLQRDFDRLQSGWRALRAYLESVGAVRSVLHVECGLGGNVHAHALVWMEWLSPRQLARARSEFNRGARVAGNGWLHVGRVRKGFDVKKAIAEVAKYVTKGVVPSGDAHRRGEQTHPLLAAMVDTAWKGKHLWREYGDWDELPLVADENAWSCPRCGGADARGLYMTRDRFAIFSGHPRGS